jgi:hypothetical protein
MAKLAVAFDGAFDGTQRREKGSTNRLNNFDAAMYFRALSPPGELCAPKTPGTNGGIKGDTMGKTLDGEVDVDRNLHAGDTELSRFPIREQKLARQELRADAPSPSRHLHFLLVACGMLLGMAASHLVAKLSASRGVGTSPSSSSSQATDATLLQHAGV